MQPTRPVRLALAVTVFFVAQSFTPLKAQAALLDGVVAYWDFNTDFKATIGGAGYDAVEHNGPIPREGGRFGDAARFTRAQSQYLEVTSPVITQGRDHTYSAWYRSTVADIVSPDRYFVLETTSVFSASYGLLDSGTEDVGQVYTHWPTGGQASNITGAAGTGWHNIIVTYDADSTGAEHAIYLDGAFIRTFASSDTLMDSPGLIIGGHRAGTGRNWDGWIDDVAFWDRVLTTDEIAAIQSGPVLRPFVDIGAGLPGLYQSRMAWGDYDNDGDLDLLLAGFLPLTGPLTRLYRNDGGTFVDVNAGLLGVSTGSVAWGDLDGDGYLDIALSGNSATGKQARVYRNAGPPDYTFTDISADLPGAQEGTLAWGDYDNDGDMDLLLTGSTVITSVPIARVYNNTGTGSLVDANAGLEGTFIYESGWVDYDNDGDLDISSKYLYRNEGGSFVKITAAGLPRGGGDWGDFDNDGDLDLLHSHYGIYRNENPSTPALVSIDSGLPDYYTYGTARWGDYDNDGDLDVLIGGRDYYTSSVFSRIYRNDDGLFYDIGAGLSAVYQGTMAWGDYDADGDLDLVQSGAYGSPVRIYRNDGAPSNTAPGAPSGLIAAQEDAMTAFSWAPASDAETPASGLTYNLRIGTSPGGIEVLAPMADPTNGYRRVVGLGNTRANTTWSIRFPGAGTYYWSVQAVDGASAGSPFAPEQTLNLVSNITFADIAAGLTGVADASTEWGDYDSDGDLDLLLTGFTGSTQVSFVYRNDGGVFTDIAAGLPGVGWGSADWGDYDNDGDLDILLTGASGTLNVAAVYRNDAGSFTDIAAGLPGVVYSSVTWGDYDNDGDLDILLTGDSGSGYLSRIYRNDAGAFSDIAAGLPGVTHASAEWGDYDADGDLDVVLSGDTGSGYITNVYQNDAGLFTVHAGLTGVWWGSVAWGDYDNDGDLDLVVTGNASGGPLATLYRKDAGTFTDALAGLPGVRYSSVKWGDYDNDGDLDLALSGDTGAGYVTNLYQNDEGTFTDILAGFPQVCYSSLAWGDYDNDDDLDLILTGYGPRISRIYRNDGAWANAVPGVPTALSAQVQDSLATFSWSPTFDAETPTAGLTYNLRLGTTPGGNEIISAMADASDGYRRVVERGNCGHRTQWTVDLPAEGLYYWSVQALDGAYAGSPFAAEQAMAATRISFTDLEAGLPGVSYGTGAWGDYDNDGDLDLFWGGSIYRYDGAGTFTAQSVGLPGGSVSLGAWGDYDNDGDLDIMVSGVSGGSYARVYRNSGGANPTFTDIGAGLPDLYGRSGGWGDFDNDGDLDLALANFVYRNDGGVTFTDIGAGLPGVQYSSSAWGDYDNDGDLDILLVAAMTAGSGYGVTRVYKNDLGSFTDIGAGLPGFWLGTNTGSASWGDYDGDGDLDILLTGATASGRVSRVYENDAGVFTKVSSGLPDVSYSCAAWGDYDNDGDLDILLSGIATTGLLSNVYRNMGAGVFSEVFTGLPALYRSWGAWADYDADGDLDIVLAGDTGGELVSAIYQSDGADPNTPPTAPSCQPISVVGNRVQLKWDPSLDTETPATGLTYNLRVGTTPGGAEIFGPMADLATGYRRLAQSGDVQGRNWWGLNLPNGQYYWSVQAVDGTFSGSSFAPEAEFQVVEGRPDLRIDVADLSASTVGADSLILTAVVHNAGFVQSPATVVRFFDARMDTALASDVPVPPLDPGASDTSSVFWTTECNQDRFRAHVDPDGSIVEVYDGNNSAELDFGESVGIYPCIRSEVSVAAKFGKQSDANTFGKYLQGLAGSREEFTVTLDDPDSIVTRVSFVIGEEDTIWITGDDDWIYRDFDPGTLCADDTLRVTAFDDTRPVSEEEVYFLKTRELPDWLQTWFNLGLGPVDLETDDQGRSYLTFALALSATARDTTSLPGPQTSSFLEWDNQILSSIPIMGGKKTELKLDMNLKVWVPLLEGYGWIVHGDVQKSTKVFGRKKPEPPIGLTIEISPDGKHITHIVLDTSSAPGIQPYIKSIRLWRSPTIKGPSYFVGPVRIRFSVSMDLWVHAQIEAEAWDDFDSLEVVFTPSVEVDLKVKGTAQIPKFKYAKVQVIANPNFEMGPIFTYTRADGVNDFDVAGFWRFSLSGRVVASITYKVWRYKKTKKWTVARFTAGPWGETFGAPGRLDLLDMPFLAAAADSDTVEIYVPDMFPYPNAASHPTGTVGFVWIEDVDPDTVEVSPQVYYAEYDSASATWPSEAVTADALFKSYTTMAYLPSGDPLAVWVQASYDSTEVDTTWTFSEVLDRQDIWYAAREGSVWTPAPLFTELPGVHRADGVPAITATDSGAMLLWARAGEGDSALATGSSEIFCSVYSGGSWSAPDSVTDDSLDDTFPALCSTNNDTTVAVWLREGALPPNELVWSRWDGSAWLTPAVLSGGSWTKEPPSVACTDDGRTLAAWVETELVLPDTAVVYHLRAATLDAGGSAWSPADEILMDSLFIETPTAVVDRRNIAVIQWRGYDGMDGDLWYSSRDLDDLGSAWTTPRIVQPDTLTDWMATTAVDDDNNLYVINLKSNLTEPPPESSAPSRFPGGLSVTSMGIANTLNLTETLNTDFRPLSCDLTFGADSLWVLETQPTVGDTATVVTYIRNIGDYDSDSCLVRFYDGHPDSGGTLPVADIPCPGLAPDESVTVAGRWPVAAGDHELFAVVDPDSAIGEQNESNNRDYVAVSVVPDLAVDSVSVSNLNPEPGDPLDLHAFVSNGGGAPAVGFTVHFGRLSGASDSLTALTLAPGADTLLTVPFTAALGVDTLYAHADPDSLLPDPDWTNNRAWQDLRVLPDLTVEIKQRNDVPDSIRFREDYAESLKVTIENIGGVTPDTAVAVRLYSGNPRAGGVPLLADIQSPAVFTPGAVDSSLLVAWSDLGTVLDSIGVPLDADGLPLDPIAIFIVVDPDGLIEERSELNNEDFLPIGDGLPQLTMVPGSIELLPVGAAADTVSAWVSNLGTASCQAVRIEFFRGDPDTGGVLIDDRLIPRLVPGETVRAWVTWEIPAEEFAIHAVVDRARKIAEHEESDNRISQLFDLSVDVPEPPPIPLRLALHPAYPNPFAGRTTIGFDLPEDGPVKIQLFDVAGRLVRILADEDYPAGRHVVPWDGQTNTRRSAAVGIYFIRLRTEEAVMTRKIVKLE